MRDNYFTKLIKYINKVYHIDKNFKHIKDKRVNPTYKTSHILSLVLTGFLLRIKSFNQLNLMIKAGEFNSLFATDVRIPKIDSIRNALKSVDIGTLRNINLSIIKKTCRNKVLDDGTINGYTVAAIDGTRLFRTEKSHCTKCLRIVNKEREYHYHECSVMSLVGNGPNLVLDYELIKRKETDKYTSEGEIITSKRLLNRVVSEYEGLVDIVTYDALACTSPFINECINLNIDAVIRIKKSHIIAIKAVKHITNKKESRAAWLEGSYNIKAYESVFYMDGVKQPLRYVKFFKKHSNGNRTQVLIVTTAMNIHCKTLYKIIKARWNIENRVFNNLKNNASLNHCFVHGENAVEAVLYLMFIASNLFQLFKVRRIKNHVPIQRELVRLLYKGLYLVRKRDVLFLNSS